MEISAQLDGFWGQLRTGRAIVLLSVLVVALIGGAAGFMIWHDHQTALKERKRDMATMGVILAEQTARYVQVIDLIVSEVQTRVSRSNITTSADFQRQFGSEEIQSYLAGRLKNVPQIDAVVLIDANGLALNTSRAWPVEHTDASSRNFYNYFKEHNDPGLFIGSLSRGIVTGKLSLYFARRANGPEGQFLGVVLGITDVTYLVDFYQIAGEYSNELVTLLDRNGAILVRYPNPAAAIGVTLQQSSPWYSRVANGGGSYVAAETRDDNPSLVSVHPLRDYPLVVDVSIDKAKVFSERNKQAFNIVAVATVASLSFLLLFWMLARQFRLQAEQNASLEDAAIRLNEGQQTLLAYAEMSVDWFWEQDADFRFKQKTLIPFMIASDDTGKTRWELAGSAMSEERWAPHKADLAARLPFRNFRWERVGEDGARHVMIISGDPVFDRDGAFAGYRGTGREITQEVEAQARLARVNFELELGRGQFDAVLGNISQGVCFFDGDKRLLLWNRRYTEIYDLPPGAACVGRSLEQIAEYRLASGTLPDRPSSDYIEGRDGIDVARRSSNTVAQLMNGRVISIHYQPMPGGGWVATQEDITERQRAEASVLFLARHDALTQLPNRVLFKERMDQAIEAAGRGIGFAVICLDLDKFKQVNDTFGHPVGDGLLVAAANRLLACVREGDTVARLGGDEFAIIQLAVQKPDDAELLASRIIAAFRQPFTVDGHQLMAGTSVGVTVAPGDGASYKTLMSNADIALYLAKTEGRGTVRFFEPEMDARIHMRRELDLDVQGAIARNEFELYYQPLVSLVANKIVGFEALLRWQHPVRGLVSPSDFIPIAEETGRIVAIGEWVMRTACFEARNWPSDVNVAVNLSSVQFRKGDLVAIIQEALAASGLPPYRLELEITESVLLHDAAGTLRALHQLRAMGISVALDDFGTGYSSLSYLRSFPFDKIKIDQSFVRDSLKNKEAMSIIRAIAGLGQSLEMKITAEGVETMEQSDWLREEGCTEAQGYFFSRPMPASELPFLIESFQPARVQG